MYDNADVPGFITVPEAARRLNRSTEQVRRYLREGKLAGRRIGGQWFIDERDLEALQRPARSGQGYISEATTMYRPTTDDRVASKARIEDVIASVAARREEIRRRLGPGGGFSREEIVRMIREDRDSH